MKKLLVLALAVVLVLSIVSIAAAGTMTWTGDLRQWFYSVHSTAGKDMNSFGFDRIELQWQYAASANEGVSALYQWRNFGSNTASLDARLDSAFYYNKGLLSKYDEFDIGALDKLPFRLGLSKNCNFIDTGLGSKLKVGNSTGFRYEIDDPAYTVGFGVVNGNMKDITDTVGAAEGFAYSVRLDAGKDFFTMVPGLRLGAGFNRVPDKSTVGAYKRNTVIDAAYVQKEYWASFEHAGQIATTAAGVDGLYATADYIEAGMNFGKNKVWVGRLIGGKNTLGDVAYKDSLATNVISGVNDGTIIAGIYAFPNKVTLQGQYIVADPVGTLKQNEFDIRFRYDF